MTISAVNVPRPPLARSGRSLRPRASRSLPPQAYFLVSAVFHYLGPAFAVLLFARVDVLGVAWLRIASAALVFAVWRRPWRALLALDAEGRRLLVWWGVVLAVMNACFYVAIDRLPLGTVAAIEFLPVVALAALGARTARNAAALVAAVAGVYLLTDVVLVADPLGIAIAFANAALFSLYIVLAHRVAKRPGMAGIDGLGAAMLVAAVAITPIGGWAVVPALGDPVAIAAGVGVGICSSVIPYVTDQLAMRRLARSTYALMVSLLPATATVIGILVLGQVPTLGEAIGVALVVAGVALHRELAARDQAGTAAVGEEAERPLDEDEQAVLEADQVPEVYDEPGQPGGEPAEPDDVQVGDRAGAADRCEIALVAVAKRADASSPEPGGDEPRGVSPLLHRDRGHAGEGDGRPVRAANADHVAERQHLGMAG